MPTKIKKEELIQVCQPRVTLTFVEEPVEIDNYKYALVGVDDLNKAEDLCRYFKEIGKEKKLDNLKATIHPLSSKSWNKKNQNSYTPFFDQSEIAG